MIQLSVPHAPRRRVEAFAHALSGAVEQTERWWRNTPELTRAEAVRNLSEFAWRGLRQLVDEAAGGPEEQDAPATDESGGPPPSVGS